jgi:two-component system KDP operon response regulator KdpE
MSSLALLRNVWGPTYAYDSALLRTHIANLRHKIDGANAQSRSYIQTEAGVGYRFPE